MSMSVYVMNYSNGSRKNLQNDEKSTAQKTGKEEMKTAELQREASSVRVTKEKYHEDGTVSMVRRMQETEACRQIRGGGESFEDTAGSAGGKQSFANIRTDTVMISEEGRRSYAMME